MLRPYMIVARRDYAEGFGMGGFEFKPRDLGSDRGYRVVRCFGVDGVKSKPAPF
jgi:hypothetical protein